MQVTQGNLIRCWFEKLKRLTLRYEGKHPPICSWVVLRCAAGNCNHTHHHRFCDQCCRERLIYCLFVSDDPDPPSIRLNSDFLANQTEVHLTAGSAFNLSCHGKRFMRLTSTSFRLFYRDRPQDPVVVSGSDPRHTGTYYCGYINQSLEHLDTWIHLYVTGKSNCAHSPARVIALDPHWNDPEVVEVAAMLRTVWIL